MRSSFIIKFPALVIAGSFLANAGEPAPRKRSFRSIIVPGSDPVASNPFELTQSDVPALKTLDRSGRGDHSQKALRLAQSYYKQQLWESASNWYRKSLELAPKSQVAAEGFVMSSFHLGRFRGAYEFGEASSATSPQLQASVSRIAREKLSLLLKEGQFDKAEDLLGQFPEGWEPLQSGREQLCDLQTGRDAGQISQKTAFQSDLDAAELAYQSGQYTTSLWNLDEASRKGPLPRKSELTKGRSLIHLDRFDEAARLFEKLYQTQTDIESARGIVVALHKKGDHDRLARLANEWGGVLAHETETYHHRIEPVTNLSDANIDSIR